MGDPVDTEPGWTVNGATESGVSRADVDLHHVASEPVALYSLDIAGGPIGKDQVYRDTSWHESDMERAIPSGSDFPASLPALMAGTHKAGSTLAEEAGVDVSGLDERTLDQIGYTAVQVAVWAYTDGCADEIVVELTAPTWHGISDYLRPVGVDGSDGDVPPGLIVSDDITHDMSLTISSESDDLVPIPPTQLLPAGAGILLGGAVALVIATRRVR